MNGSQRFYYGWRIVAALALTQTVGFGVLYYAFSVFVLPMESELGWTRAQTSSAFSLGLLVAGLTAVPVGHLVDRQGARLVMTLGSLLGAGLFLAWSQVTTLLGLYLIWAALGLAMSTTLYDVAFTVVAVWFRRHRARTVFAVTMVAGLASTIFIPLTTLLVTQLGWRSALVVLATILALTAVPLHALVLRRHPRALGLEPDGSSQALSATQAAPEPSVPAGAAFRTSSFWWLAAAFALVRLSFAAMGARLVPLLLERGYTPALVALAVGAIGPLQLLGRAFFLPLNSRWPVDHLTAAMFACVAAAFVALVLVPGMVGVGVFVVLYGASNGATTLARAEIVARRYGPANYGSINGALAFSISLAGAFAPFGAGVAYAVTGGYDLVLWLLAVAAAMGMIAVMRSRVPAVNAADNAGI
ncbi:MAG: MFS transporter [Deinococcota bacterium]|nr:MFS transporter [Deinococcota bacterium]